MYIFFVFLLVIIFNHIQAKIFRAPATHAKQQQLQGPRQSSKPFISGDTFRAACDFIIDEQRIPFDTDKFKSGDVIFLKTDLMPFFFKKVQPHLKKPYILVTHNSAQSAPGKFSRFLNDKNLIAWFGQNCDTKHHKFIPIPLGIGNAYWPHGNTKIFNELCEKSTKSNRLWLAYLNISSSTHDSRINVINAFANKPWCASPEKQPFSRYLEHLSCSKFVVSPRGRGIDCHRTWEALLCGAIPIVEHSTIDHVFEGLPVVLINDWCEVTKDFLEETYKNMQAKTFDFERLFANYWIEKIGLVKKEIQKNTL
jgi:hypothetical protein